MSSWRKKNAHKRIREVALLLFEAGTHRAQVYEELVEMGWDRSDVDKVIAEFPLSQEEEGFTESISLDMSNIHTGTIGRTYARKITGEDTPAGTIGDDALADVGSPSLRTAHSLALQTQTAMPPSARTSLKRTHLDSVLPSIHEMKIELEAAPNGQPFDPSGWPQHMRRRHSRKKKMVSPEPEPFAKRLVVAVLLAISLYVGSVVWKAVVVPERNVASDPETTLD